MKGGSVFFLKHGTKFVSNSSIHWLEIEALQFYLPIRSQKEKKKVQKLNFIQTRPDCGETQHNTELSDLV